MPATLNDREQAAITARGVVLIRLIQVYDGLDRWYLPNLEQDAFGRGQPTQQELNDLHERWGQFYAGAEHYITRRDRYLRDRVADLSRRR
jgi:hypothetical protein